MDRFIGLYWTLPVPWAGFTSLPADPEAAAQASQTIRYQRESVRRWVKDEWGTLIHEEVFLELAPDRGTEHILPVLDRLLARGRREDATLVLVEFWSAHGWRRHGLLAERLAAAGEHCMLLEPDPLPAAEGAFDPVEHFRTWRAVEQAHAASKSERQAALGHAIAEMERLQASLNDMAAALNEQSLKTATGKPWTAANLRKFMKAL